MSDGSWRAFCLAAAVTVAVAFGSCGHGGEETDSSWQTETDREVSYETERNSSERCETDTTLADRIVSLDSSESLESMNGRDSSNSTAEDDMRWKLFDEKDEQSANYEHNSKIRIDGFVKYGQENEPVCNMILGKTRFAGVGCEVIAAYNYLLYIGEEPDMAKLAAEFEKNALIAADGSLGSNPRRIGGLFKAMDIDARKLYKAQEAQAALDEGRPVIVSFHIGKNVFSGIHTVFAVKENGRIWVYNRYNSVTDQTETDDIYELMDNKSLFIVGYTTGEDREQ